MRRYYPLILLITLSTLLFSCKDSELSSEVGIGIQPEKDKITIKTTTFEVESKNQFIERIYNRPDSLLLGFYDTQKYGEVKANILSQFEAPFDSEPNKRYPTGTEADSAFLILQYSSFFGAANSTMQVNVFELNKNQELEYSKYYPSDIKSSDFVNIEATDSLLGKKVFTAKQAGSLSSSGRLRIKLNDTFKEKIFNLAATYKTREDFLNGFKGVFINTDLGDATILNISSMNILLHYSYPATIEGKDTLISNNTLFPSNDLISKVNQINYTNREKIKDVLSKDTEYNYLSTPANIYTEVNVPLRKILQEMYGTIGDKKLTINHAALKVEGKNEEELATVPPPSHILLADQKNIDDFATEIAIEKLIFGRYSLAATKNPVYAINIASILAEAIEKVEKNKKEGKTVQESLASIEENLNFVLIPARITESKNQQTGQIVVTAVNHQTAIRALTIHSGKNKKKPMKIELVYSGF